MARQELHDDYESVQHKLENSKQKVPLMHAQHVDLPPTMRPEQPYQSQRMYARTHERTKVEVLQETVSDQVYEIDRHKVSTL